VLSGGVFFVISKESFLEFAKIFPSREERFVIIRSVKVVNSFKVMVLHKGNRQKVAKDCPGQCLFYCTIQR